MTPIKLINATFNKAGMKLNGISRAGEKDKNDRDMKITITNGIGVVMEMVLM